MSPSRWPLVAAAVSLTVLAAPVHAAPAATAAADRAALTAGVPGIHAPGGLVSSLTLLGSDAFPVIGGSAGRGANAAVVAAARAGKGRVVLYGHDAFLQTNGLADAGTARFLANAARWAGGGKAAVRVGTIGEDQAGAALKKAGFPVKTLTAASLTASGLADVDVVIANPDAFEGAAGSARTAAAQAFVRSGGGLITWGVGWGWAQIHPDGSLTDDAGFNRVLPELAGLGVGGGTADPTGPDGAFLTGDDYLAGIVTAADAVAALEKSLAAGTPLPKEQVAGITRVLGETTDVLPASDTRLLPRLKALIAKAGPVVPTKYSPVTIDQPLTRVAAALEAKELARTPVDRVKAHPSAAAFPGAVPAEAPRLTGRVVSVDTAVPDWHSTGLYAAPGEVITVTIPASAAGKGLGVRIGAHRDTLWNLDTWPRFPAITTEKRIVGTTLRIANAFGGTVYVVVPRGATLGTVPVTVSGAVAQPYFVKGRTTPAEWAAIRSAPAPWAELQGDRVILTVPSTVVRNLADPEALMTYWDQVADAAADLYAIPHERARQERYCPDIEISAGYMHSGYPIMTHDDVAATFVSLRTLRGPDGNKTWGFYHELGHNHQQREWTWNGLTEVTNNLFSLYGGEQFNAQKPDYAESHGSVAPETRRVKLLTYLASGKLSPEGMTSDPFLALIFFIDLREGFGWDPFKKVFGEYREIPPAEKPRTELEKHDEFLVRFSNAVGKNLGPYFQAWGLTTSDAVRAKVAGLPAWMPSDWPTPAEVAARKAALGTAAASAPAAAPGR